MLGAITGDIIGSRFETENHKTKDFSLFGGDGLTELPCTFTDDTVLTVALADTLLNIGRPIDEHEFKSLFISKMHHYGNKYIDRGFGYNFYEWLENRGTKPYNSFGNGSAMRVSPIGWYSQNLEECITLARFSAEVTHNHPEGVKGAEAVAAAVFLARKGKSKEEIKEFTDKNYYRNNFLLSLGEIRLYYGFDESCQGSVPIALIAFFEADSYEDAVRNAVSVGGDSDTIADIAGAVAEAYFGMSGEIKDKGKSFLTEDLLKVTNEFTSKYC